MVLDARWLTEADNEAALCECDESRFGLILTGVLFLDTGTVEKNISFGSWRSSVGFGVRFTVPFFGPVPFALDFGIPISKQSGDETEIFSFSIGTSF